MESRRLFFFVAHVSFPVSTRQAPGRWPKEVAAAIKIQSRVRGKQARWRWCFYKVGPPITSYKYPTVGGSLKSGKKNSETVDW